MSIISGAASAAFKSGVSQLSRFTPTLSTIARSASASAASASASASATPAPTFKLPTLPYQYNELEPAITGQIMETHHSKHHQAYVNNLNNALAQYAEAQVKNDVAAMIRLQPAIRFNGGGHINHSIFWTNLAPPKQGGGVPPEGALLQQINRDFGSFDRLKTLLQTASVGIQGSGWGWLAYNPQYCRLEVVTRANQDPMVELVPLLGIDVWEHAYYYLYGPNRVNYLNAIWTVVNWKNVAERYAAAVAAAAAAPK